MGREKVLLRVITLQVLGEAYMGVKRDLNAPRLGLGTGGAQGGDDSEYVKEGLVESELGGMFRQYPWCRLRLQ